jgi:hypothetical protein
MMTSREYIEFLRNEINATETTLPLDAYRIQTDPFFDGMKDWGDTIWDLWTHNMNAPGAAPIAIASGEWDFESPTAVALTAFDTTPKPLPLWVFLIAVLALGLMVFALTRKRSRT